MSHPAAPLPSAPSSAAGLPSASNPLPALPSVLLSPLVAGVPENLDISLDVLLRVQAPDRPARGPGQPGQPDSDRPPLALALVIDCSGSMSGAPLAEALRCADHVIGHLQPTDSLALVQFDHRVQCLWPATPVGDGRSQRQALTAIEAGGNTNLHGGWRAGAEALAAVAGDGLKRVILLSDGQANSGLTDPAEVAGDCGRWTARGITTSTYGLGRGFNEELMVSMARTGGGSHYYGDTADDLMAPFQEELALIGDLCMRRPLLKLRVPEGLAVEVVNQLPRQEGGWRLPDLAWGAEAWALLRVSGPATCLPERGQPLALLQVDITGQTPHGEPVTLERTRLSVPVLRAAEAAALVPDPLVQRRRVELDAAALLRAIRSFVRAGDWTGADHLLEEARERFADSPWVSDVLRAMTSLAARRDEERMAKEGLYASERMRNRLVPVSEELYLAERPGSGPAYLRRRAEQGKAP